MKTFGEEQEAVQYVLREEDYRKTTIWFSIIAVFLVILIMMTDGVLIPSIFSAVMLGVSLKVLIDAFETVHIGENGIETKNEILKRSEYLAWDEILKIDIVKGGNKYFKVKAISEKGSLDFPYFPIINEKTEEMLKVLRVQARRNNIKIKEKPLWE